jgi:ribosome biogenesis GTPase / thiamine phosphate phosphatase
VMVINKIDLSEDVDSAVQAVASIAEGAPILPVSATERLGIDLLQHYIPPGRTAVLLGPSGVGKSALINALLGEEEQETGEVRSNDRRGRHTTTRRELFLLPGGGAIIDTPGLREVQPWAAEAGVDSAFEDIRQLASQCRFKDCQHDAEPDCAVHQALADGRLDMRRFENYQHMKKEMAYQVRRRDQHAQLEEKKKWKKIALWMREIKREHGGP